MVLSEYDQSRHYQRTNEEYCLGSVADGKYLVGNKNPKIPNQRNAQKFCEQRQGVETCVRQPGSTCYYPECRNGYHANQNNWYECIVNPLHYTDVIELNDLNSCQLYNSSVQSGVCDPNNLTSACLQTQNSCTTECKNYISNLNTQYFYPKKDTDGIIPSTFNIDGPERDTNGSGVYINLDSGHCGAWIANTSS